MGKVTKNRIASIRASAEFENATISGSSVALPASGGGGATTEVYAAASDLPLVGNTTGDQAYVTGNNRLYLWNGSGWYNVALINRAPTITIGAEAGYLLASDGTPTVISLTAVDSDGTPLTWSYSITSGSLGSIATISQDSSVFTITPSTNTANAGTFGITFTASDGISTATSTTAVTLQFISQYWEDTILSIGTSSTNGLGNNTFVDRSTYGRTVTKYGSPVQTAFHPYLDNWSVYFPSGAYSYIPASNTYGTNDFCLEAWIYPISISAFIPVITQWNNGSNQYGFHVTSDRTLMFYVGNYGSGQGWRVTSQTINLNEWSHIAVTRANNVWRFFINGVEYATTTYSEGTVTWSDSRDFNNTTNDIGIGGVTNYTGSLFYLSNVRIVRGSAVYTTNFTPSGEKLTDITNTRFLGCQSNRFIDNSSIANTWSPTSAEISSLNPFGQLSEYANGENKGSVLTGGTGDYLVPSLTVPNSQNYTVECWLYILSFPTANAMIMAQYDGNGLPGGRHYFYVHSSGELRYWIGADGTTTHSTLVPLKTWTHIAAVKSGTSVTVYVNGVGETDGIVYDAGIFQENLQIGGEASNSNWSNMYISDYRITYDTVYTSNFTPPTSPVNDNSSHLYLPFDNAGIFDKTGNHILTPVGNVATSTTQTKYATTSIAFDGTDDYILAGNNQLYDKDFTIELWWYPTSTARQAIMHGSWGNDWSIGIDYSSVNTNQKIGIWASSNGSSWNLINSDNAGNGIGSETINQNAWNHIAYTRQGTTWRLFVNGVLDVELTGISGSIARPTQQVVIGAWFNTTAMGEISGYIEGFQLLRGIAKYTANFTPPAVTQGRAYQAQS